MSASLWIALSTCSYSNDGSGARSILDEVCKLLRALYRQLSPGKVRKEKEKKVDGSVDGQGV